MLRASLVRRDGDDQGGVGDRLHGVRLGGGQQQHLAGFELDAAARRQHRGAAFQALQRDFTAHMVLGQAFAAAQHHAHAAGLDT